MTLTSAYRPVTYQQHLIHVWDKWMNELKENQELACAPIKSQVEAEFTRHQLLETQRPVEVSDHTLGVGFDANVVLPNDALFRKAPATVDNLAKFCRLMRPSPANDHVHFRLGY